MRVPVPGTVARGELHEDRAFYEGKDVAAEFAVLVLDQDGVAMRFSTPSDEWAETTPLGRFRQVGARLYRLGSDASGAFIARYDLERR